MLTSMSMNKPGGKINIYLPASSDKPGGLNMIEFNTVSQTQLKSEANLHAERSRLPRALEEKTPTQREKQAPDTPIRNPFMQTVQLDLKVKSRSNKIHQCSEEDFGT